MSTRPAPARPAFAVTVPTPWYPTPFNRMSGSFVAEHARLVSRFSDHVRVVHAQEWPGGTAETSGQLRPAFDGMLERLAASDGLTVAGAVGPVLRVPVFTVGGTSVPERAEAMVRDVQRVVGRFDTPVVHGHVGYWGGLLAARLADPSSKVFATEHSTGLREVLADPAGRDHYAELLDRADRVFCVSGLLRDQILDALPGHDDTVEVLHNPVEFRDVPQRTEPVTSLDRWVFVGGLIERKGVERLVAAFCTVARENPAVRLTMYGDGPLREKLLLMAHEAGLDGRLQLRGVVRHGEVLADLPNHDLLLAPSTYETFHLAVVEGVAAGLPVIVTRSGGPQEALAGVEDRVGRFIDVGDDPDAIVAAYRELGAALETLDPEGARRDLDARYGPDAVAARLAAAYGAPGRGELLRPARNPAEEPRDPDRVVLVAASAWRRYCVQEELHAVRRLKVPAVVVTGDPQVTSWAKGLRVVGPKAVAGGTGAQEPFATTARKFAGRLKRRLTGEPSALPPSDAELTADDLTDATVVVTDCQSMRLVAPLLDTHPSMRVAVELDRGGRLFPPPDARDEDVE